MQNQNPIWAVTTEYSLKGGQDHLETSLIDSETMHGPKGINATLSDYVHPLVLTILVDSKEFGPETSALGKIISVAFYDM